MIEFRNNGEIDIRAIRTFGVSSKESANPIGYFGTGLKYAIAVLLREGCSLEILTGGERYTFDTVKARIRVDDFEIVRMNGDELGFTTELGKDWELWQAYRELYCNTQDEGGNVRRVYKAGPDTDIRSDETVINVMGRKFEKEFEARADIILETEPVAATEGVQAHIGTGNRLYYRNVRVKTLIPGALYNYNITKSVDLTEDRTLRYEFQARWAVAEFVMHCNDRDLIRRVLLADRGNWEFRLDFDEPGVIPTDTFLDVVGELSASFDNVNRSALALFHKLTARDTMPTESVPLTVIEQKQLDRAKEFVTRLGCDVDLYEIIIVDYLGNSVWGRAVNDKIYLSKIAFGMGTKCVAGTLFEEYIHVRNRLQDCTREMQNFLIDRVMTCAEEIAGEPI